MAKRRAAHGWRKRGSGKLPPRAVRTALRDREAVMLRNEGRTYDEIKDRLGYSHRSAACKAVERAIRLWCSDDTATLRYMEYLRLEQLFVALWPLVDAQPPRLRAIDLCLKIYDRKVLLTGNWTVGFDTDRGNARQELDLEDPHADAGGDWTDLLEERARGKTFAELAAEFGLGDRAAAYRRVDHDMREFLRGARASTSPRSCGSSTRSTPPTGPPRPPTRPSSPPSRRCCSPTTAGPSC